jgi:hypothetical protein
MVSTNTPVTTVKSKEYGTIQIAKNVKEQIVDYCNQNDLKIGKFIERLFLAAVSGSK